MDELTRLQLGGLQLIFGKHASMVAGEEIKKNERKKALIVTDQGIVKNHLIEHLVEGLKKAQIEYALYDTVHPDPSEEDINGALQVLRDEECDAVIGIGGGSCMDTAKGVRIMATNPGSIFEYDNSASGKRKISVPGLFLLCIPTTSGTGSEVTPYAVISNHKEHRKATISGKAVVPDVSVLDPYLTMNLPPAITAATGMDALAHAIGGYTSKRVIESEGDTSITDIVSIRAIELIAQNIRTAYASGHVYEARSNMMMASLLAALAANAGSDAAHGLGHALGAIYGVPHGVACAIMEPYVMEQNVIAAPERFARIAEAMGVSRQGMNTMQMARAGIEEIRRLQRDINIPPLSQYVKSEEDEEFALLCKSAVEEKCSMLNPRMIDERIAKELYEKALTK